MKTTISRKGQVVIPKEARERAGLTTGAVLRVEVDGKRVVLEPLQEPPEEVFIEAGSKVTEPLLREAKVTGDKAKRLLRELGVQVE